MILFFKIGFVTKRNNIRSRRNGGPKRSSLDGGLRLLNCEKLVSFSKEVIREENYLISGASDFLLVNRNDKPKFWYQLDLNLNWISVDTFLLLLKSRASSSNFSLVCGCRKTIKRKVSAITQLAAKLSSMSFFHINTLFVDELDIRK